MSKKRSYKTQMHEIEHGSFKMYYVNFLCYRWNGTLPMLLLKVTSHSLAQLDLRVSKKLAVKGHGTHFLREYPSHTKRDEYSRRKWVPHPLISKFFNHLQLS